MGPGMGPEVDFPPAFPAANNLQDICRFSKAPVRYPKDTIDGLMLSIESSPGTVSAVPLMEHRKIKSVVLNKR
ncbi:hypothetical protein M9458_033016, partial [Cirrhinus mrigala]